jgi:hypothetical protein
MIEPETPADAVDQRFRHRTRDRMTDRAILAGLNLVLEDHAEVAAIIPEPVRRAHQPHHLVAFDDAGARKAGEGADRGDVIDFHAQDISRSVGRHACGDAMVAGVDVGNKRLHAICDIFDGPARQHAQADNGHVLVIDMQLHAE